MNKNYEKKVYFIMALIFSFSLGFSINNFNRVSMAMASSEVVRWGVSFKEENQLPDPNLSSEELIKYDAFYYDEKNPKTLYLTFDAGFENGTTESLLATLEKHNITAVFFLVSDYIEMAPEMVKLMLDKGHIIGNHTNTHPDMHEKNEEDFKEELLKMEQTFNSYLGYELEDKFYRPPQGRFTTQNLEWANDLGYTTLLWSVAYVDWELDNQPSREDALSTLYSRVHDGAIILLHPQSTTNAEILDEFITNMQKEGYEFGNAKDIT